MARRRWRDVVLVLGLLGITAGNLLWRRRPPPRPPAGGSPPSFVLPRAGGGEVRFDGGSGRPTVIDFWATWCGPCRTELPVLDRLAGRHRGAIDFIAVSVDEPGERARVLAFLAERRLSLPVALDGLAVANRFLVTNLPHLILVGAAGRIREQLVGGRDEAELDAAIAGLR